MLGFDVGARRIGVALGNTFTGTARALEVVAGDLAGGADWPAIERLVAAWKPGRLVVGEPLTLDGGEQAASRRARAFAAELGRRFEREVDLVDERSSSREADRRFAELRRSGQARRRQGAELDALAAAIIVERWLVERGLAT